MRCGPCRVSAVMKGLGLLLLSMAAGIAHPQENTPEKHRFLSEAPKKWAEYRDSSGFLQGQMTSATYRVEKGTRKLVLSGSQEIKESGLWTYNKLAYLGPRSSRETLPFAQVHMVNSRYEASVEQKEERAGWLLTHLNLAIKDGLPVAASERKKAVTDALCNLLRVGGRQLPDLIKTPGFTLKGVSDADAQGKKLVRVAFSIERPKKNKYGVPGLDGWVLLEPDNYWVVRRGEFTAVYPGEEKAALILENEFAIKEPSAIPVPVRSTEWKKFVTSGDFLSESSFSLYERDSFPEIEFSLTALGLPEPVGISFEQPTRWHLWFGLGAIVCLAIGVGCYRLARRTSATSASPEAGKT
jgi:hypothetical protein